LAQRGQQFWKEGAFRDLGAVVLRPILRVGLADRLLSDRDGFRHDLAAVAEQFPLPHDFDRHDMLAFAPPYRIVGARARRRLLVNAHNVFAAVARLTRNPLVYTGSIYRE
jgi:hypothetical protein